MINRTNIFYCTMIFFLLLPTQVFTQQPLWRLAKGTENVYTAAIAASWSTPETLYALGARQIDAWTGYPIFLRSTDAGESWDSISNMGAGLGALKVDPSSSRIIYASHPGWDPESNDLSMSTDGGYTWNYVWHGRRFPAPIIEVDPIDRTTIYATMGPGMLWVTTDHGQTWQWTHDTISGNPTSMAIAPTNDSIMWTSGQFDVRKSTDRGASFIPVFTNSWLTWSQVAINPKNSNIVYVSFFDTLAGLFKTTDGGITWQDANGDLPPVNRHVWRIALNPRNPEEIFIGVGTPTLDPNPLFFRSTDGGINWSPFSDGLPVHGHIESLLIDTVANRIFAGGTSGIYITDYPTSAGYVERNLPTTVVLYPNYPNPFNPRTTIEFFLSKEERTVLEVFDILGEKVSTIVDGIVQSGSHRVLFDAPGIGSGIYIYRLKTPTHSLVEKMMVMK